MVDELDRRLARMLLKEFSRNESWTESLCTLSQSMRCGKLFLERGALDLPDSIVQQAQEPFEKPLIQEGSRIYFLRSYLLLQRFMAAMQSFLNATKTAIDLKSAYESIERGAMQQKQREACLLALSSPITLIMGGPGTGKTYTAAHIVKALQGSGFKIAIAAPTGKAASNLKTAIAKTTSMDGIDEPKTLHSLLGLSVKSKTLKAHFQLEHDLYIVDEASMIDMELMTALFCAMKPSSKLILLGDPNQLPPIGLGAPFEDIAEGRIPKFAGIAAIELETCMRSESHEVLDLSSRILEGDPEKLAEFFLTAKKSIELVEIDAENTQGLQKEIIDIAIQKYASLMNACEDPEQLFSYQKEFALLTPFRIGPLGSDTLNQLIARKLNQRPLALPIMVRENRGDLGLYNGDLGFLICKDTTYGLFKNAGEYRTIPEILLPVFDYAFCLSIHKSQGSEFKEALIILPPGSESFGKKILYTALTRVKERAVIYSKLELLQDIATEI